MRTRTKLAIAIVTVALVAAVVAIAFRPWARRGGSTEVAAPGASAAGALAFQLRPGSSRAYTISFTATSGSPGSATRETTFEGQLNVRVIAHDRGGSALAVELDPLRVRVDGAPQPAMEKRYSVPFVVPISPSGRLGESLFPPELPQGDRALLDGAIRAFQVVLPPVPRDAWKENETDNVGTFVASYRRGDGPFAVEKTKARYTAVPPPALFSVKVLASALRVQVDATGPWLARAEGSEQLRLAPAGGAPAVTVQARFKLEPTSAPLAVWREDAVKAARVGVNAGAPAPSAWDEAEREAARRRFKAAGVTLDTLVARARTSRLPDSAFAHELAAFLRAFPDAAGQLPRRLREVSGDAAALLVHALGLAGTPEAQDALLDVAESGGESRANRVRALVAFGGVETPTGDTLDRLGRDARAAGAGDRSGIASTATLTLGALAPKAPDGAGERIVRELSDALRSAKAPREQQVFLLALENAHAALPADTLAPYLASPDAGVREVAARLGGNASGGDPTGDLIAALAREQKARVRSEIISGLLARPPDQRANSAIVSALTGNREPDAAVRARMIAYLARQFPVFPSNREALRAYLPREPDRSVTVAILNALAS